MNKVDLAKKVAEETGLTDRDAEKAIDTALDVITESIKAGEEVMLTGFGVFSAKTRHARQGVNPRNPSEKIQIPEIRVPKFKAGKALKDAVKKKGGSAPAQEESTPEPASEPKPDSSANPSVNEADEADETGSQPEAESESSNE